MKTPTLLMAAFLAAACRGDPEDLFFIVGTAADPIGGEVLKGQKIQLERDKTEFCGGVMQRDSPTSAAGVTDYLPFLDATADEQGRYLFEVMRFQVAAANGRPYCLRAGLADDGSGGEADVVFAATYSDLQPPPLFRWNPPLSAAGADGGIAVALPALPIAASPPGSTLEPADGGTDAELDAYEWTVSDSSGRPVWREEAKGELAVPPEALEDFPGPGAMVAFLSRAVRRYGGPLIGSTENYQRTIASAPVPIAQGSFVPLSRGEACATDLGPISPCTLTDGDLALIAFPQPTRPNRNSPPVGGVTAAMVTLGAPAKVGRLVVRDLFGQARTPVVLVVEGSADGATWIELGRKEIDATVDGVVTPYWRIGPGGFYEVVDLDRSLGPVAQVRLRFDGLGFIEGLREISVFP